MALLAVTSLITFSGVSVASSAAAATGKAMPAGLITWNQTPCWTFLITYPGAMDLKASYITSTGKSGFLTPVPNLGSTDNAAWFCLSDGGGRVVTDPMSMTISLTRDGQTVTDLPVQDARPREDDQTAFALGLLMARAAAGDVAEMTTCHNLGIAYPSTAVLHVSEPDITAACLDVIAEKNYGKLIQVLAETSVVGLWLGLQKMIETHPAPNPAPAPGPYPDPEPTPDPDPQPDPTQVSERDLVIERIQDRVTALKLDLSPEDVEVAADTCLATQQELLNSPNYTGDSSNPCLDTAIFFPGFDAGGAAIHDREAIQAKPEWALLTYRNKKKHSLKKKIDGVEETVPTGWYKAAKWAGKDTTCTNMPVGDGKDCDEYPYISTMESGPGASLKLVPGSENQAEGRVLKAMYRDTDCNMDTVEWGSSNTQFLVIPVAVETTDDAGTSYSGPPSFHVCGDAKEMPQPAGLNFN